MQQPVHIGLELESIVFFTILAIAGLVIDLFAHRADKPISLKSATFWTLFWISLGITFGIFLNFHFSSEVSSLYFAGYSFEMALSVDNLFAIMAVFSWFGIKSEFTHRVLYFGVLGAVVFRLIFVLIGSSLFALGPFVEIVFSIMVALSAVLMIIKKEQDETSDFSNHPAYKVVKFFCPIYPKLVGHNFFLSKHHVEEELKKEENKNVKLQRSGALYATPLFLCLAIVETSDIMFAFDSVPAVIAVSEDPFIVYSCMIFAILGLRSMYFILEALRNTLVHLEKAVIFLLFFVAFKLAASATHHLFGVGFVIDVYSSLVTIAVVLGCGVVASFVFPKKEAK